MATQPKRELTLREQGLNIALLEAALHPEHLLDRSRPLPYAWQNDPESALRDLVKIANRDAWMTNDRR